MDTETRDDLDAILRHASAANWTAEQIINAIYAWMHGGVPACVRS